ncbi:Coproporphyrinogen-III oxidase [Echinococcus granulosus]|uniref:coproporphyrinogen oxidase n=1 Tax=Echinococcus granulosus TaxID=6210 RepID=U6JI20_ECHGR|nr:Coproporphyrinogen-III oxidase [Echinococcus granulosus]EUB55646.1 Coproporphyrinogen-III oxidase [Echinococcus granulosus]CDS23716.1 coproporphyrinogen III oxidase [Echinococcus granulosus]
MCRMLVSVGLGAVAFYAGYKAFKHVLDQEAFPENTFFENDLTESDPSKWMADPITPITTLLQSGGIRSKMEILCMDLQSHLCRCMGAIDGKARFTVDRWIRGNDEGGGISCVLQEGGVFEKAAINISVMTSSLSDSALKQMKERLKELENGRSYKFSVVGISSVNHPRNPHAPTMHFNYRYFEVIDVETGQSIWWFGGGCDLTPSFLYEEDVKHFHGLQKAACDAHSPSYYHDFKKWCDEYFFIKHRGEARGVGGIFFDDLDGPSQDEVFLFVRDCAAAVAPSYLPIIMKRLKTSYNDEERQWQLLRRGRYVEFNLIYDRGTKFGLFTPNARIESIFVSMPLYAKWVYCHDPSEDKRHLELLDVLTKPRDWA